MPRRPYPAATGVAGRLGAILLLCLVAGPVAGQPLDSLPIRVVQGQVLLPVSVNGAPPVWFLWDTGAGGTLVDSAYAAGLGLVATGRATLDGSVGRTEGRYLDSQQVRVGLGRLSNLTLYLAPLDHLSAALRVPLAGILGYDLLKRAVVEVDPRRRQLRLHSFDRPPPVPDSAWLPVQWLPNHLLVVEAEVVLDTTRARLPLVVDSGSNRSVSLDAWVVDSLGLMAPGRTFRRGPRARGISREAPTQHQARLDTLRIGRYVFPHLPVVYHSPLATPAPRDRAGLLGNGILLRYRTVFDYARSRMAWLLD